MTRSKHHHWLSFARPSLRQPGRLRPTKRQPLHRRLRFEPLEDRRLLATITVDTLTDLPHSVLLTSLRDAIGIANNGDTINFAPALFSGGPATIQLSTSGHAGEILINKSLTITGPGNITIKAHAGTAAAGDGSRIFNIDDGSATQRVVNIVGVTLSGGDVNGAGGAIFSREDLAVSFTVFSSNSTADANGNSGGAIYNDGGTLEVSVCILSLNHAGDGGGAIFNAGGLTTITHSTLSGNTARFSGGAIFNSSGGMYITNSTIAYNLGNYAGGGLLNSNGSATLRHVTITGNTAPNGFGGGIASVGNAATHTNVYSSIVSENANNDDVAVVLGATNSFTSLNYNLTGGGSGNTAFTGSGDRSVFSGTLGLGPLAYNGGLTPTRALLLGSLAINGGDPAAQAGVNVPVDDQRGTGFGRVFGARIDIGAYEYQQLVAAVVDTVEDEDDGIGGFGDLSLREALSFADVITFALPPKSIILLTRGELAITESVNIQGPGATNLTIDASGNDPTPLIHNGDGSRVFNVSDSNTIAFPVSISGLALSGGDVNGEGGAIRNTENLTVADCVLIGNAASTSGGGVASFTTLTISGSKIFSNRANSVGGGIFSANTLNVVQCTVSENLAIVEGGGIHSEGSLTLTSSTVSNNFAGQHAGGISSEFATIANSTISGNAAPGSGEANGQGGGIKGHSFLTILDSTISGNSAILGGGIFAEALPSQLRIYRSTITGNVATGFGIKRGGGIRAIEATLTHTIVAGNFNGSVPNDLGIIVPPTVESSYNLIGDAASAEGYVHGVNGNIVGMPIQFILNRALTDNGGPTLTHALTLNSVALDVGDPQYFQSGVGGIPLNDQRGAPYERVYNALGLPLPRIDIGAVEAQPTPVGPALLGDYTGNGVVDAADFVAWRGTLGDAVTPFTGADGNGNGVIDQGDCAVWRAHFGQTMAAGSGAVEATALAEPVALGAEDPHPLATDAAHQYPLRPLPGGEVFRVARPEPLAMGVGAASTSRDDYALRPRLREVPPARRDDALVAWLASGAANDRQEVGGASARSMDDESADASPNAFDAVFERLSLDL